MPNGVQEWGVWTALAGGLITLAALALAEWLAEGRSLGALRNLMFVLLTGSAVVLITGLPRTLWPALDGWLLRMLTASMGPLAAGVTLFYLGQWMGGMRQDALMARITRWSAAVMTALAAALALAALLVPAQQFRSVLWVTAVCNVLAVLPGFAAALRAASLGDPLARWMALAVAVLGAMTAGLYLYGLGLGDPLGLAGELLTALLTLTYFVLASSVVSVRNRELRRLKRLSSIEPGTEPATGLPTGSHLLRRVEDAFWTAARRQARCTVVCLYLENLYELVQHAETGRTEYQALVTMAARIRRAAGFRCVVGIYHPRCFVVVITHDGDARGHAATLQRLHAYVGESIALLGDDGSATRFVPRVGIGVVEADAAGAVPRVLLDEAEAEARAAVPPEADITRL